LDCLEHVSLKIISRVTKINNPPLPFVPRCPMMTARRSFAIVESEHPTRCDLNTQSIGVADLSLGKRVATLG
jgi:hypothetical protein